MMITLIGMSNLGKKHWSNRLVQECEFERVDCDSLVEAKLGPYLKDIGYSGIQDVAKWMGFPFDQQYPETSSKFVECERTGYNQHVRVTRSDFSKLKIF